MPNMNDKIGGADQLDFSAIISSPFKDRDWFKKTLLIGLLMLVPIVGLLNIMGWMRVIADRRIAGGDDKDVLPEANLDYIGPGWRLFLAYLPLAAIFCLFLFVGIGGAVGIGVATGGARGHGEDIAVVLALIVELLAIALSLVMWVVNPAIYVLHIVDGEPWASIQFKRIWETIRAGGTQYLLLFVAFLVAMMIAQLGVLACYVGMLVTMPLSYAMMGAAIADYARLTKPQPTSFPLEGGTGGSSGSPFGVKL